MMQRCFVHLFAAHSYLDLGVIDREEGKRLHKGKCNAIRLTMWKKKSRTREIECKLIDREEEKEVVQGKWNAIRLTVKKKKGRTGEMECDSIDREEEKRSYRGNGMRFD